VFDFLRKKIKHLVDTDYDHRYCKICDKLVTHENDKCMICSGKITEREVLSDRNFNN
jgi:recombinational DNA repair protein RecR